MNEQTSWEPCPQGELVRLAQLHRPSDITRRALIIGGFAGMVILAAGAVSGRLIEESISVFGCDDVRPRLDRYMKGTAPPGSGERIAAHLAVCSRCRRELEHQRLDMALARVDRSREESAGRKPAAR